MKTQDSFYDQASIDVTMSSQTLRQEGKDGTFPEKKTFAQKLEQLLLKSNQQEKNQVKDNNTGKTYQTPMQSLKKLMIGEEKLTIQIESKNENDIQNDNSNTTSHIINFDKWLSIQSQVQKALKVISDEIERLKDFRNSHLEKSKEERDQFTKVDEPGYQISAYFKSKVKLKESEYKDADIVESFLFAQIQVLIHQQSALIEFQKKYKRIQEQVGDSKTIPVKSKDGTGRKIIKEMTWLNLHLYKIAINLERVSYFLQSEKIFVRNSSLELIPFESEEIDTQQCHLYITEIFSQIQRLSIVERNLKNSFFQSDHQSMDEPSQSVLQQNNQERKQIIEQYFKEQPEIQHLNLYIAVLQKTERYPSENRRSNFNDIMVLQNFDQPNLKHHVTSNLNAIASKNDNYVYKAFQIYDPTSSEFNNERLRFQIVNQNGQPLSNEYWLDKNFESMTFTEIGTDQLLNQIPYLLIHKYQLVKYKHGESLTEYTECYEMVKVGAINLVEKLSCDIETQRKNNDKFQADWNTLTCRLTQPFDYDPFYNLEGLALLSAYNYQSNFNQLETEELQLQFAFIDSIEKYKISLGLDYSEKIRNTVKPFDIGYENKDGLSIQQQEVRQLNCKTLCQGLNRVQIDISQFYFKHEVDDQQSNKLAVILQVYDLKQKEFLEQKVHTFGQKEQNKHISPLVELWPSDKQLQMKGYKSETNFHTQCFVDLQEDQKNTIFCFFIFKLDENLELQPFQFCLESQEQILKQAKHAWLRNEDTKKTEIVLPTCFYLQKVKISSQLQSYGADSKNSSGTLTLKYVLQSQKISENDYVRKLTQCKESDMNNPIQILRDQKLSKEEIINYYGAIISNQLRNYSNSESQQGLEAILFLLENAKNFPEYKDYFQDVSRFWRVEHQTQNNQIQENLLKMFIDFQQKLKDISESDYLQLKKASSTDNRQYVIDKIKLLPQLLKFAQKIFETSPNSDQKRQEFEKASVNLVLETYILTHGRFKVVVQFEDYPREAMIKLLELLHEYDDADKQLDEETFYDFRLYLNQLNEKSSNSFYSCVTDQWTKQKTFLSDLQDEFWNNFEYFLYFLKDSSCLLDIFIKLNQIEPENYFQQIIKEIDNANDPPEGCCLKNCYSEIPRIFRGKRMTEKLVSLKQKIDKDPKLGKGEKEDFEYKINETEKMIKNTQEKLKFVEISQIQAQKNLNEKISKQIIELSKFLGSQVLLDSKNKKEIADLITKKVYELLKLYKKSQNGLTDLSSSSNHEYRQNSVNHATFFFLTKDTEFRRASKLPIGNRLDGMLLQLDDLLQKKLSKDSKDTSNNEIAYFDDLQVTSIQLEYLQLLNYTNKDEKLLKTLFKDKHGVVFILLKQVSLMQHNPNQKPNYSFLYVRKNHQIKIFCQNLIQLYCKRDWKQTSFNSIRSLITNLWIIMNNILLDDIHYLVQYAAGTSFMQNRTNLDNFKNRIEQSFTDIKLLFNTFKESEFLEWSDIYEKDILTLLKKFGVFISTKNKIIQSEHFHYYVKAAALAFQQADFLYFYQKQKKDKPCLSSTILQIALTFLEQYQEIAFGSSDNRSNNSKKVNAQFCTSFCEEYQQIQIENTNSDFQQQFKERAIKVQEMNDLIHSLASENIDLFSQLFLWNKLLNYWHTHTLTQFYDNNKIRAFYIETFLKKLEQKLPKFAVIIEENRTFMKVERFQTLLKACRIGLIRRDSRQIQEFLKNFFEEAVLALVPHNQSSEQDQVFQQFLGDIEEQQQSPFYDLAFELIRDKMIECERRFEFDDMIRYVEEYLTPYQERYRKWKPEVKYCEYWLLTLGNLNESYIMRTPYAIDSVAILKQRCNEISQNVFQGEIKKLKPLTAPLIEKFELKNVIEDLEHQNSIENNQKVEVWKDSEYMFNSENFVQYFYEEIDLNQPTVQLKIYAVKNTFPTFTFVQTVLTSQLQNFSIVKYNIFEVKAVFRQLKPLWHVIKEDQTLQKGQFKEAFDLVIFYLGCGKPSSAKNKTQIDFQKLMHLYLSPERRSQFDPKETEDLLEQLKKVQRLIKKIILKIQTVFYDEPLIRQAEIRQHQIEEDLQHIMQNSQEIL